MKTATKNYIEANAETIAAGGSAARNILDGIAHIKNGEPDNITNNNQTYNTYAGDGTKTSTIIIVAAVLIVAVVGVVLFTRK